MSVNDFEPSFIHSYATGGTKPISCSISSSESSDDSSPPSPSSSDFSFSSLSDNAISGEVASLNNLKRNNDDDSSSTSSSSSSSSSSSASSSKRRRKTKKVKKATKKCFSVTPIEPNTSKKVVLVTGGAGFIGSSVAAALLRRGDDVVVIDEMNDYYDVSVKERNLKNLTDAYTTSRLNVYNGNITDAALLTTIFETHKITFICHLAARAGVRPSINDPFVYINSNIVGQTTLMEFAHKYKVENFVYASSSSVYGGLKKKFFSEEDLVDNPVSPYAATKKACELLAYTYHHLYKLNTTGLRFFTVYGPKGRPDMAPFKFIDRVSQGIEIQQFGDGSSSRDYTYIDDIVDGVLRSIDRPYGYQVFNLGKGDGTSLKQFIGLVEKYVGKPAKIKQLPDQAGDVPYTCADVTAAKHLLGYSAQIPFEEGIKRTVAWYKEVISGEDAVVAVAAPAEKKAELNFEFKEMQGGGLARAPRFVSGNEIASLGLARKHGSVAKNVNAAQKNWCADDDN